MDNGIEDYPHYGYLRNFDPNDVEITTENHPMLEAPTDFDVYSLFSKPILPTLGVYTISLDFPEATDLPAMTKGKYQTIVGMTMYNEDKEAFERSLRGVLRHNSTHKLDLNKTLVIILVDGIKELHASEKQDLIDLTTDLGLYDKISVENTLKLWNEGRTRKPNDCCFVFQSKVCLVGEEEEKGSGCGFRPLITNLRPVGKNVNLAKAGEGQQGVDVLLVVKPDNRRKLHSHLWLMYGFCLTINPTVLIVTLTQLLDIGTEPLPGSLSVLEKTIIEKETVGGCCGEIIVRDWKDPPEEKKTGNVGNDIGSKKKNAGRKLVACLCLMAQWFEYKIGHALYKPLEHMFGYISVLPGAFSAYRWAALCANDYRVLKAYFKPFIAPHKLMWIESNIYFLAEDRIMSEEIIKVSSTDSTHRHGYVLAFAQGAKATTEGAPGLIHFIQQRRRWINGAWFALIKIALSDDTKDQLSKSAHPRWQRSLILMEMYYLQLLIAFTWMSVGGYYLAFSMVLRKLLPLQNSVTNEYLFYASKAVYIFVMMLTFIVSLALNPKRGAAYWYAIWAFMSVISVFITVSTVLFLVTADFDSMYAMAALYSVIAAVGLAVFLYFEDWLYILATFPVYILLLPTYVNILSVYAICKTDDLTWGTRKTSSENSTQKLKDHFSRQKTVYLMIFTMSNVLYAAVFEGLDQSGSSRVLEILYGVAFITMLCPVLACIIYAFTQMYHRRKTGSELPLMNVSHIELNPQTNMTERAEMNVTKDYGGVSVDMP